MKRLESVHSEEAPAAIGPYSQAIRAGQLLFCSGQIGLDPSTGEVVPGGVRAQTEQVLRNLDAVLRAGGSSRQHLVRCTLFLRTMDDFAAVNEVYGAWLGEWRPARATVAVAGLPRDVAVEIDAVAVVPEV